MNFLKEKVLKVGLSNLVLAAVVLAVGIVMLVAPAITMAAPPQLSLPPLSTDSMVQDVFNIAFQIVNGFIPLIGVIGGIGLGFNLVNKLIGMFSRVGGG